MKQVFAFMHGNRDHTGEKEHTLDRREGTRTLDRREETCMLDGHERTRTLDKREGTHADQTNGGG